MVRLTQRLHLSEGRSHQLPKFFSLLSVPPHLGLHIMRLQREEFLEIFCVGHVSGQFESGLSILFGQLGSVFPNATKSRRNHV